MKVGLLPLAITSRLPAVKKQYEFIKESNLYGFAEDCCAECEETGKMPVVQDDELEECEVCIVLYCIVFCILSFDGLVYLVIAYSC